MQAARFRVGKRWVLISRDNVLAAIRHCKPSAGTRYCVWHRGKTYPPKRVLGLATGIPPNRFAGGSETNRPLRHLGFLVTNNKKLRQFRAYSGHRRRFGFDKPVPSISNLLKRLFSGKWNPLTRNFRRSAQGRFPGVYLLAYSDVNLTRKPVRERDVFYVGMSNAALASRLNQFCSGVKEGGHHSAGERFFRSRKNYGGSSGIRPAKSFFVAVVEIPCETEKDLRRPIDLRKMGRIAEVEYAALARIKHKTGFEPLLNKK